MYYPRFLLFSVLGSILWIGIFVAAGYVFGNFAVVKRNHAGGSGDYFHFNPARR